MRTRSAFAALFAAVAVLATLLAASLAHRAAGAAGATRAAGAATTAGSGRHFSALGATLAAPTPEALRKAGAPGGALVVAVDPDGPAAQEEFLSGDVITEFEGHAITNVDDLVAQLARKQPGEMVRVRSWRKGGERMLSLLTLGAMDPAVAAPAAAPVPTEATSVGDRVDRLERELDTLRLRVDALEKGRGAAH